MATVSIKEQQDKRNGIIASVLTMLILFLYLYLTKIAMADPPPRDIPVTAETTIEEIQLKDLVVEQPGGSKGGGTPSDEPISEPKPQTEKVLITNKPSKTQEVSGQSKNMTNEQSSNSSGTVQKSENPFGSGGSGTGKGSGKGNSPFGSDAGNGDGDGEGDGKGSGKARVRVNEVNIDNIYSERDELIHLRLTVDANGNVISATKLPKTSTTDQILINQVIAAVKSQVKYSKGTKTEQFFYTVKVNGKG